jgi:hypothetical protein
MVEQVRGSQEIEIYERILRVVIAVYRPITLEELPALVDIPDGVSNDNEFLTEVIGGCGSFLILRERDIFFVHQSAKDFLLETPLNETLVRGIEAKHHMIFSRSLQVISKTLHCNIYDIRSPGFPVEQVARPNPDPLCALGYSCIYWVDHLQDSYSGENLSSEIFDWAAVDTFLQQSYLHWLEALSLLRSISRGIAAILKLEKIIQVSGRYD